MNVKEFFERYLAADQVDIQDGGSAIIITFRTYGYEYGEIAESVRITEDMDRTEILIKLLEAAQHFEECCQTDDYHREVQD